MEKKEDFFAPENCCLLLMEDDEMTRQITTSMLEYLGFTVETVTTGEEAVGLYRLRKEERRPFKAVILDIYQPEGIGGKETVRRLLEYDPDVRAIATSGLSGDETMTNPGAYGFLASLPKPYGISQLGSVLRNTMDDKPRERRWANLRKDVRHGTVAKFEFVVGDGAEDICEGITINVSRNGFGFLTEKSFAEGQPIIVTKHDLPSLAGKEARVMWVRKGPRNYQAGAQFIIAEAAGQACTPD